MSNQLPESGVEQPRLMYLPTDQFWSGYPGETKAGMDHLRRVTGTMPYGFDEYRDSLPERVDPRLDEKFAKSWMRVENQGGVGAPWHKDMPVTMADGSTRAIAELMIGDLVAPIPGTDVPQVVTELHRSFHTGNMVIIKTDAGHSLDCTDDHELLPIGRGPTKAIDISVGDKLFSDTGKPVSVSSVVTYYTMNEEVVCVTVGTGGSLIVGGVVGHQCQGYGLVQCIEYLYAVLTGDVIQLAPLYAYLLSQYFDGIVGDRGSTLSGGTKLLEEIGLCLLEEYSKERSYPRNGYKDIPQSAIEAAKAGPFKTLRTVRFKDADESRAFIGSMAGILQTGTAWTEQLANVPSHGVIQGIGGRNFGGHSYNICGYMPIDDLGAEARRFVPKTRGDKLHIVTNSHSTSWAEDGFGYLTDELFNQLNSKDLLLGRTDMGDIKPRPSRRDFTTRQNSPYRRND